MNKMMSRLESEGSDGEIVMAAGTANRRSDSESVTSQSALLDAGDGTSPEADSVRIMELKLALVKEQREREREKMRGPD